jgi:hypothetical protein
MGRENGVGAEDRAAPPAHVLRRLVGAVGPIGPGRRLGDQAWMVTSGGRLLVAKVGAGVLDEADGLRRLGQVPGGPPVPEIVLVQAGLLVTTGVEQVSRTSGHEESLGRALAAMHHSPFSSWGGGSSWIGSCPVDPAPHSDGAALRRRRLLRCPAVWPGGPLRARGNGDRSGCPSRGPSPSWWTCARAR